MSDEVRSADDGAEEQRPFDVATVDRALIPWFPITLRDWLVPPVLFGGIGAAVAAAAVWGAVDPGGSASFGRQAIGWAVAGIAVLVVAIIYAALSHRVYRELTESSARRLRGQALRIAPFLAATIFIASVVTGSHALAYLTFMPVFPAIQGMGSILYGLDDDGRTAALPRIRTTLVISTALAALGAVSILVMALVDNEPFRNAITDATFLFLYGLIVALWAGSWQKKLRAPRPVV